MNDDCCGVCVLGGKETIEHTFRGCPWASETWLNIFGNRADLVPCGEPIQDWPAHFKRRGSVINFELTTMVV